jgi:nucleoside-diphosphate-sugar epimerase
VDLVVHLAGKAHAIEGRHREQTDHYLSTNLLGTERLVTASCESGVTDFFFMSSVKAVESGSQPERDGMPDLQCDPYGYSKRLAEEALYAVADRFRRVIVLRPALVYGPGVRGYLYQLLRIMDLPWIPRVPEVGNRRSMISVDDLSQVSLHAIRDLQGCHRPFFVTDGEAYSTARIASTLRAALGRKVPNRTIPTVLLRVGARIGDLLESMGVSRTLLTSQTLDRLLGSAEFDSSPIWNMLGLRRTMILEDAAPAIVADYRQSRLVRGFGA